MRITKIIRDLDEIVDLIIDKKQVVGMFQGKGEWGPRALGNRSILFDPTNPEAKQIVNTIKNYEPRVSINNIQVTADVDKNSFNVYLEFYIGNNSTPTSVNLILERSR